MPRVVAVVKMVSPWIVEVYRPLDKPKPEKIAIESNVRRRVARNGSNVVYSWD